MMLVPAHPVADKAVCRFAFDPLAGEGLISVEARGLGQPASGGLRPADFRELGPVQPVKSLAAFLAEPSILEPE